MPTVKLTKTVIDSLSPQTRDVVYWDATLAGFGVKVTPKGRKVFILLYRTRDGEARLRKFTIGRYGPTTLATARIAAQKLFAACLDGRDPAKEKRDARIRATGDTIAWAVEEYFRRHGPDMRTSEELSRLMKREIVGYFGARSIHSITKQDVIKLLDAIVDRGSPGMANKVFTSLRALFNFLIRRGAIERSPCTGLLMPSVEKSRDRVLSDAELAAVIRVARKMGYPYGSIVELLILTGQRRGEVASMRWQELELNNRHWNLPAARTKNGKPHLIQLSSRAQQLLDALTRSGEFVFRGADQCPPFSFAARKRELDLLSGVSDWVLHDLRRTVVSGMARLGIAPHVADKILNHQSGTISGVAAVYQRHEFLEERKQAIELWANHIGLLLRPQIAAE